MYIGTKRVRQVLINIIAVLGGVMAVAVLIYAAYYNTRFYPGTFVEGVDCSGLTAMQAEERLNSRLMDRGIEIVTGDGRVLLALTVGDLYSAQVPLGDSLKEMMAAQHSAFFGLFRGNKYEYSLRWPDAQALMPLISAVGERQHVAAVNAAIVETDGGWAITASSLGSQTDNAACAAALADALAPGRNGAETTVMRVTLEDVDVVPAVSETNARLMGNLSQIDEALGIEVTVDFGAGIVHTFSYRQVRQLYDVSVDGERVTVTYVPERLRPIMDEIIELLGADGAARKYGVIGREQYYYDETWDEGFVLYRDELYAQLDALFTAGKSGTVTARYDYIGSFVAHYNHEWVADTYIEISIDNQHMWYYVDGELLVDTPVVTGCVATGDDTRKGVFYVKYLDERAFLSGGSTNRGSGYWVDYWMPFDGHIGLHDAQWVSEFGGDIYLEDGSHGCVNTPLEAMEIIFNNTERFCTVVVH